MKNHIGKTALVPAIVVLAFASSARADDTFCPPFILFETVDNVIADGLCIIRGSRIEGSIEVDPGGSVVVIGTAENPSSIEGNLESEGGILVQALGEVHIRAMSSSRTQVPAPQASAAC